jgi:hypothetical protein
VLLVECNIVIETMAKDLSYRWHGGILGLLVDCIVFIGLLEETIMEDYIPS